jgi:hypothetical protein
MEVITNRHPAWPVLFEFDLELHLVPLNTLPTYCTVLLAPGPAESAVRVS